MLKNGIVYTDFSDWIFDLQSASGSLLFDSEGNKFIDFTSGWNIYNLGWNNTAINSFIAESILKHGTSSCIWATNKAQRDYVSLLLDALGGHWQTVGKATGGTEANEEAMKTARVYTKKQRFISFRNTYHGQSFATMALGMPECDIAKIKPVLEGITQISFPETSEGMSDAETITNFEKSLRSELEKGDVAGVVTEAGIITGWGSTKTAPQGFASVIRSLTKEFGCLWILDEVGTGFSRTGTLFGFQREGEIPDIITLAKAITNGAAPLGLMITTGEISNNSLRDTNLTSSFGLCSTACYAAQKTLELHVQEQMWLKAENDGQYIRNQLDQFITTNKIPATTRGFGMEIGLRFISTNGTDLPIVNQIVADSLQNGLHTVCDHENNIQIMPPLTTERTMIDEGLEILKASILRVFEQTTR